MSLGSSTRSTTTAAAGSSSLPSKPAGSIDPAALMRIKHLPLRAKLVVEGFLSGLHRSPFHGFSVEFTEYRQYSPGDDLRYLDWRLLARSDRYYLKRFEDETNLRCHLLVDLSKSMNFGTPGYSKLEYAQTLAATFAYFLNLQRDAVGLLAFDSQVQAYLPARFRPGYLRRIMLALEHVSTGSDTDLAGALIQTSQTVRKRGLIVLISDLLTPPDALETPLAYLRARGHEVAILHVLDPAERDFPFQEAKLFYDLETGREFYVDPATAKAEYQAKLHAHLTQLRACCMRHGIDFYELSTTDPLDQALFHYLSSRIHRKQQAASGRRAGKGGR